MRKFLSFLLVFVLVCSVVPAAFADSLMRSFVNPNLEPAFSLPTDSSEFYTIGNAAHTFAEAYTRMHIYLDLKKYPIPEPTSSGYSYVTGAHDEFTVLKDDDDSYDYIGYVCGPDHNRIFIIWSWSGYHQDGSLIGVDSFYTLDGVYLGQVQRDYSSGAAISSSGSPFFYMTGSLNGKA